jgi:uroporphyrinogen-III synthase
MTGSLDGLRVAVPESRELDLFVSMLERAGATAMRCPLVSIHDLHDDTEAQAWIRRLGAGEMDDLVFYTGEGVNRLRGIAERAGLEATFTEGLRRVRKIVRGPKPTKALRGVGLAPELSVEDPTTAGLIAAMSNLGLSGHRVGVQLYPNHPDDLLDHLRGLGAKVDPVLPYRYASDEEDGRVVDLVQAMAAGQVDLIALTSTPQVRRLQEVAAKRGLDDVLRQGAQRALIAAVGPVTAEAARKAGWDVAVVPDTSFHLKPFIAAIATAIEGRRGASAA